MKDLEARVREIEKRNQRVELDKKWGTSWTRRLSVAAMTYMAVFVYLIVIDNDKPAANSIVPTAGFLLSALVMKSIRNIWQRNQQH